MMTFNARITLVIFCWDLDFIPKFCKIFKTFLVHLYKGQNESGVCHRNHQSLSGQKLTISFPKIRVILVLSHSLI